MDMSFHLQQLETGSRIAMTDRVSPDRALTLRWRSGAGDEPTRVLTHAQLMALVLNRTNRNRMRHWQSEAGLRQKVADAMAARVALFAGTRARFPAWARVAVGSFLAPARDAGAMANGNKAPVYNREDAVYLGALSNRKVLSVNQDIPETILAPAVTSAFQCDKDI